MQLNTHAHKDSCKHKCAPDVRHRLGTPDTIGRSGYTRGVCGCHGETWWHEHLRLISSSSEEERHVRVLEELRACEGVELSRLIVFQTPVQYALSVTVSVRTAGGLQIYTRLNTLQLDVSLSALQTSERRFYEELRKYEPPNYNCIGLMLKRY